MVYCIANSLITGDPLEPGCSDIIAQRGYIKVGEPVPDGGWRVLSGNMHDSTVARVVMRYEIEDLEI